MQTFYKILCAKSSKNEEIEAEPQALDAVIDAHIPLAGGELREKSIVESLRVI